MFAFLEAGANAVGSYVETRTPINLLLQEVLQVPGRRLAEQSFVPIPDFEAGQVVDQAPQGTARTTEALTAIEQ